MQVAYYALHYGCEYLAWSIRSVQNAVDEIHIFYVSQPSYGHTQGAACPDSRAELDKEARRFCNKPLVWHDCPPFRNEGQHRGHAVKVLKDRGVQQILIVDADEVWLEGEAARTLEAATRANRAGSWTVPFLHFIRSTAYAVKDHFRPVRVIDFRFPPGKQEHIGEDYGPVLHFGYAQRDVLMRYKWTCHGHQPELRPDWLERFLTWTPQSRDLHPVVVGLWDRATLVDEALAMKIAHVLEGHPYLDVEVIR